MDRGLLERMCRAIEHRGPDSRGVHCEGPVGLGIQRLRVIDLETGDQPIYSEDGSITVVLNGEIYNFKELRDRLRRNGHVFATSGDTEVIVHLYEEEGPDCVRSLQGMFAFALWDAPRRRLLVARDRVGKKPLFYSHRGGSLAFASELAALIEDEEIPRDIDHSALDCYLSYGYVQAPKSIFKHVRKLPPATSLVYENGAIRQERYWRLDYSAKREIRDVREVHEELRGRIRGAVRRRMIADVPLGAFLSGGIDSSAVVAAMAEASSGPVKTFSIGFDNARFNELAYAREIAELFGTEHHEFIVEPDAKELVPKIVRQYGEPFADSSAIPSFYVAELTRRHVTVALNGDGGDESFAGYSRYAALEMSERMRRLPGPLRSAGAAVAGRAPNRGAMDSSYNRARRILRSLSIDGPTQYARQMAIFDDLHRDELYGGDLREAIGESSALEVVAGPWREASGRSPTDVMLEVDVESYLPGDLLVKMDIATMAHSLEARSPLLDPEIMEFAASLPSDLKLKGMQKKVVLRDALRGWIPDDILDRPKMGFGVPLADWFRGELRDWSREILLDERTIGRGYFEQAYVRQTLDRHGAGVEDASPRIWALIVLELWHRQFVDAGRPALAQAAR